MPCSDTDIAISRKYREALTYFFQAVVVAHLSTQLRFDPEQPSPRESHSHFNDIIARAINSNDAHQIKLIYTCYCEYKKYNDARYIAIAERALQQ